jgi:hypothetical protein
MVFLREKVALLITTTKMSKPEIFEDHCADNPSSDALVVKVLYSLASKCNDVWNWTTKAHLQ